MSELVDFANVYRNMAVKALTAGKPGNMHGIVELMEARLAGGNKELLAGSAQMFAGLGNYLISSGGDRGEAVAAAVCAVKLAQQADNRPGLLVAFSVSAAAEARNGNATGAGLAFAQAVRLAEELRDDTSLAKILSHYAEYAAGQGFPSQADDLARQLETVGRRIGDQVAIAKSLAIRAGNAYGSGNVTEALALSQERVRIAQASGDKPLIADAVGGHGFLLTGAGRLDEAQPLIEEAESMARELGDKVGLAKALGGLALISQSRGDLKNRTRALACFHESETICREIGDPEGLVKALAGHGMLLGQMGRAEEGLPLAEEAHQVAVQNHMTPYVNELVRPALDYLKAGGTKAGSPVESVAASNEAARRSQEEMVKFQVELTMYAFRLEAWRRLPFWRRWFTKKPEPSLS